MLNNTGFKDRIENELKTYLQDNEDNDDRNVNSEHVSREKLYQIYNRIIDPYSNKKKKKRIKGD